MQSFTNNIIFSLSLFHLLIVLIFMFSSFGNYGKIEKISTQTVTEKASDKNLEELYVILEDLENNDSDFLTFELYGYEKFS